MLPVASGGGQRPSWCSRTQAVDRLGLEAATTALVLSSDVTADEERDAREALAALPAQPTLYVERGYQRPDEVVIIQLVLGGLGAVLMLGGTLTATFLALSDARPDLATLAAVGASPRTRRGVASSYALVVGLVGALLGARSGSSRASRSAIHSPAATTAGHRRAVHYLDVPWLLVLGVVVVLPLLTAAVVGLSRSAPLAARLD